MEVRTGKTFTSLFIAKEFGARNILFVTKKKAIKSIQSDLNQIGNPFQSAEVINYESLHKITCNPDLIIIDESHGIGAYPKPSQRTKRLKLICKNKPIILLSGTPSPESYSQLFHQFWVSSYSPWSNYRNFYAWAKEYVNITERFMNGFTIKDYSKANITKIWLDAKKYFISVTQQEANFDCQIVESVEYVQLNSEQKRLLRSMKHEKFCKHPLYEKYAISSNGADLINKMSQLSGGTIIYDDDERGTIVSVEKAKYIVSRFSHQKIAILYKYKAEFEILKHFYPNWTSSPEEFNKSKNLTFIAQIKSAQEGVNLSSAESLIFYNIDFSATSYFQARSRTQSKSKKGPAKVFFIFSKGGIEDKIFQAVSKKKNFTFSYYKKLYN